MDDESRSIVLDGSKQGSNIIKSNMRKRVLLIAENRQPTQELEDKSTAADEVATPSDALAITKTISEMKSAKA